MTNTITCLVIPVESLPYLTKVARDDRGVSQFLSEAIGGYFDVAYSDDGDYHGYVHDEGLLIGLPINPVATALFGRIMAGPCVVLGRFNDEGESDGHEYSVPANAIRNVEYIAGAYRIWMESRPVALA